MNLKYFRINAFYTLLNPFSEWTRKRRMLHYAKVIGLRDGMRILDLGGQPKIWESVPYRLELTILNLPGAAVRHDTTHHEIRYVEGDACQVRGFDDRSFDSIFSNSVIEHVGLAKKQASFAQEVRRLGMSYWVQTPSKWFPIEAHCGMPLWWLYPAWLRRYFIERWRKKLPAWTQMVEEATVLTKTDLIRLFPEATIFVERMLFIPKSYAAYFVGKNTN